MRKWDRDRERERRDDGNHDRNIESIDSSSEVHLPIQSVPIYCKMQFSFGIDCTQTERTDPRTYIYWIVLLFIKCCKKEKKLEDL